MNEIGNEKNQMVLGIPLVNAVFMAAIAAVLPFLVVFNPGDKFSITSFWGGFCITIMVMVLIFFLADAIVSKIRFKAVWILFILLCPTVAQIAYLIMKKKMIR